jgi:hypothetical protein
LAEFLWKEVGTVPGKFIKRRRLDWKFWVVGILIYLMIFGGVGDYGNYDLKAFLKALSNYWSCRFIQDLGQFCWSYERSLSIVGSKII